MYVRVFTKRISDGTDATIADNQCEFKISRGDVDKELAVCEVYEKYTAKGKAAFEVSLI